MILEFDYVNYKGEAGHRRAQFKSVRFGSSPWHQEPQWLMKAVDLDKQEEREFALKDMTNIQEIKPPWHKPTVQDAKDFYGF